MSITITNPGQLPRLIERSLGYAPHDSVVVMGFLGSTMGPVARGDLALVEEYGPAWLFGPLATIEGLTSFIVAAWTDDEERARRVVGAVVDASWVPVPRALHVGATWCRDVREATRWSLAENAEFEAEATYRGMPAPARSRREALQAYVLVPRAAAPAASPGSAFADLFITASQGEEVDLDSAARFGRSLAADDARDGITLILARTTDHEELSAMEEVLRCAAVTTDHAAPWALLALAHYLGGGGVTHSLVDQALDLDPRFPLALLVQQVVERCIRPSIIRETLLR